MKFFYGWRIVVAGGALQFLQSLLLNQAFGAYLAVLVGEKGWSKTALSGAAALKSTEAAVLGPVLGWAVDRFGAQGIVRAGIVTFGVGFMLLSRIDTLVEFYAAFVIVALGASMFSNFLVSVAIIQWFEKRRARALSALQVDTAPSSRAFTAREALRTSAFWLISLGHCFSLLVVTAVNVHAITHVKEGLGYSLAQASLVFTLVTVGQFFGVMMGWVIGEKFEKRLVAAACMLMHAGGMLMLTYAAGPVILAAAALVHGTAWGLRGPFMQAIRADYFGRRAIGMIMGLSAMITVFGQIGGPVVAGVFADWTGDYRMGFTILASLAAIGSLFFYFAKKPE